MRWLCRVLSLEHCPGCRQEALSKGHRSRSFPVISVFFVIAILVKGPPAPPAARVNVADGGAMTQLARPDPARKRSAQHDVPAGPVRSDAERAWPVSVPAPGASADQQATVSQPVPGWVVVSAFLSPALLVSGWLVAGALQPASYSPMRQTMSVLAGATGTDRWVMTGALLLVGCSQIATGAGLSGVRVPARILLMVTGLSTIGIAASPEPATGPTAQHLTFTVSCVLTTAVWPAVVARRSSARPWSLSVYGGIAVTAVFAALCSWLLVVTQSDVDLGLVERLTSTAQGIWPFVVVLALRRSAGRDHGRTS
jgi:hypothetical membrane protein